MFECLVEDVPLLFIASSDSRKGLMTWLTELGQQKSTHKPGTPFLGTLHAALRAG